MGCHETLTISSGSHTKADNSYARITLSLKSLVTLGHLLPEEGFLGTDCSCPGVHEMNAQIFPSRVDECTWRVDAVV